MFEPGDQVAQSQIRIPVTLKPFFQDVEFESLDLDRHAPTIIERTLSDGNVQEIRWLFAHYGVERIRDWVRRRGALRLPRDRSALWHTLFGLTPAVKRSIWDY